MALRFTVLASGSAGNASLIETDGFGMLLDAGLGPRQLADRLTLVGASWRNVHAVLLTHTHSDHWKDRTFAQLLRHGIPLWCHADHQTDLLRLSASFGRLRAADLVRTYEAEQAFAVARGVCCQPLPLRHDGGPTFGFRFEARQDLFHAPATLAYAADLGSWPLELARALANADVLALEFNHDVALEYASGRSPRLIARVLSEEGHLSNEQAAALVGEVLRQSTPGRLRHLVQLHLSRDCNRPRLAMEAAHAVFAACGWDGQLHTASQDRPLPTLTVGTAGSTPRRSRPSTRRPQGKPGRRSAAEQRWLPGFEEDAVRSFSGEPEASHPPQGAPSAPR